MKALTANCPECGTEFEVSEPQLRKKIKKIENDAMKRADKLYRLKVSEKEKKIEDIEKKLVAALGTTTQGSQQTQGEVFEKELKKSLEKKFPTDTFERVGKGKKGADLQQVIRSKTDDIGKILWEFKNTKNFSSNWVLKFNNEIQSTKSQAGILVSNVMPNGAEDIEVMDGVFVVTEKLALSLATIIRNSIEEISNIKIATHRKDEKKELVYNYLTSLEFKQKMTIISSAFKGLRDDLESEKKSLERIWTKREQRLQQIMLSEKSMYEDIKNITGSTIPQIEELSSSSMPLLETNNPKQPKK